jgi:uncharacterized protein YlzI (FlbEa/FlbD family)
MKLIKLTTPDGRTLEVNPELITTLEVAAPGLWAPKAKAVLKIDGDVHAVCETVEQIDRMRT